MSGATEIGPLTAVAQVAQQLGGFAGLVAVGAFATSRTLSMGGVAEPAKNITPARSTHWPAATASRSPPVRDCDPAGVVVLFMRFTPEEVAEGQAATEEEHSGTGPMNLQGPAGS